MPIRVVPLPWLRARVGRASYCEIRLNGDSIPDELCRLERKGRVWYVIATSTEQHLTLAGREVRGSMLLPFDVPLLAEGHRLTLRASIESEPVWEIDDTAPTAGALESTIAIGSARAGADASSPSTPVASDRPRLEPLNAMARAHVPPVVPVPKLTRQLPRNALGDALDRAERAGLAADRTPPPSRPVETRPPSASVGREDSGWEARWRAAGAELRARSSHQPARPSSVRNEPPAYRPPSSSLTSERLRTPRTSPAESRAPRTPVPVAEAKIPVVPISVDRTATHYITPLEPRVAPRPLITSQPDAGPRTATELPDALPLISSSFDAVNEGPVTADTAEAPPVAPPTFDARERPSAPDIETQPEPADTTPAAPLIMQEPALAEPEPEPASEQSLEPPPQARAEAPRPSQDTGRKRPVNDRPVVPARAKERDRPERARRADDRRKPATHRHEIGLPGVAQGPVTGQAPATDQLNWPTAASVMALHRSIHKRTEAAPRAKNGRAQALPTVSHEPDHWNCPVWLGLPPVASTVLLAGVAGFLLACIWASDSYNASFVMHQVMYADQAARRQPLPKSITPPSGSWAKTTGRHLAYWAIYRKSAETTADTSALEAGAFLSAALQISPLDPMARLAVSQLGAAAGHREPLARSVGLSRDSVSLAWSARQLASAGNKTAALALYVRALDLASRDDLSLSGVPQFSEDPLIPRYWLPGEDRLREIIRSLAASDVFTKEEWTKALPSRPAVRLAAARLLREQGHAEANLLIDQILKEPVTTSRDGGASLSLMSAARAEAFALRGSFKESGQEYRQAIETMTNDRVRRSWWFNLADIAYRLDDDTERQSALKFALAVETSDDITRRATDTQRALGGKRALGSVAPRAN